jgi:glycosyltransferase involved in cell wall biosynthesis
MFHEYSRAQLVVSLPETDGAPATIMEALCMGTHVLASGGPTVRGWLERFGGTYGEPKGPLEAAELIRFALSASARETEKTRAIRSQRAREAFDRRVALQPLIECLECSGGEGSNGT